MCLGAVSVCSCRCPVSVKKLKLEFKGVMGVVLCDRVVGKGGKAESWGDCNTGDAGRLGNGDVELRTKGILNEESGPLLCIAGDTLRMVFMVIGFCTYWSEERKESTLHLMVSLRLLCE